MFFACRMQAAMLAVRNNLVVEDLTLRGRFDIWSDGAANADAQYTV